MVATSDASIKFHEVWTERRERSRGAELVGPLGGSQILEGDCSPTLQMEGTIR